MAQVGRAGPLQLLRGTREPRESGRVSGSGAGALVAYSSPPEPEAPDQLDAYPCIGYAMASSTACAPSLSGCSLRCHSSEIRTGCANQRPSGSVQGATKVVPTVLVNHCRPEVLLPLRWDSSYLLAIRITWGGTRLKKSTREAPEHAARRAARGSLTGAPASIPPRQKGQFPGAGASIRPG